MVASPKTSQRARSGARQLRFLPRLLPRLLSSDSKKSARAPTAFMWVRRDGRQPAGWRAARQRGEDRGRAHRAPFAPRRELAQRRAPELPLTQRQVIAGQRLHPAARPPARHRRAETQSRPGTPAPAPAPAAAVVVASRRAAMAAPARAQAQAPAAPAAAAAAAVASFSLQHR